MYNKLHRISVQHIHRIACNFISNNVQVPIITVNCHIINNKDYVTHQDIKDTIPYILRHRIRFLNQEEKIEFVNKEILDKIDIS